MLRAERIFEGVGMCLPVDEVHFNAVTALSGSGPGYQFLIMEALADAGVRVGLPRQLALRLAGVGNRSALPTRVWSAKVKI